jgi:hypothetical protein
MCIKSIVYYFSKTLEKEVNGEIGLQLEISCLLSIFMNRFNCGIFHSVRKDSRAECSVADIGQGRNNIWRT